MPHRLVGHQIIEARVEGHQLACLRHLRGHLGIGRIATELAEDRDLRLQAAKRLEPRRMPLPGWEAELLTQVRRAAGLPAIKAAKDGSQLLFIGRGSDLQRHHRRIAPLPLAIEGGQPHLHRSRSWRGERGDRHGNRARRLAKADLRELCLLREPAADGDERHVRQTDIILCLVIEPQRVSREAGAGRRVVRGQDHGRRIRDDAEMQRRFARIVEAALCHERHVHPRVGGKEDEAGGLPRIPWIDREADLVGADPAGG